LSALRNDRRQSYFLFNSAHLVEVVRGVCLYGSYVPLRTSIYFTPAVGNRSSDRCVGNYIIGFGERRMFRLGGSTQDISAEVSGSAIVCTRCATIADCGWSRHSGIGR